MSNTEEQAGLEIGKRLRLIRISQNLTQKEFALILGTSAGYISEIEAGKKIPGGEILNSIRRNYTANINWLLTGTGWTYDFFDPEYIEYFIRLLNPIKRVLIVSHNYIPSISEAINNLECGNSFIIDIESGCISLHGSNVRSYRVHADKGFIDMPFYRILFFFAMKQVPIFSLCVRQGHEIHWSLYDLCLLFNQKGVAPFDMRTAEQSEAHIDSESIQDLKPNTAKPLIFSELYSGMRAVLSSFTDNLKPEQLKEYLGYLRKQQNDASEKGKQIIDALTDSLESKNKD